MRRLLTLTAILLLLVLAACQNQSEPGLTLPTPLPPAPETAAATVSTTMPAATTVPPTAKAEPTALATVPPSPTTQPPTATTNEVATGFEVAFVELGDTLNLRSGPGADYPVVAELPRDATGLTVDDAGQALVAGSTWVWVESEDAAGYANSRYLTESVTAADFCNDPHVDAILEDLRTAVANRDGDLLASLVEPERGLRLRHSWWNNEILLRGDEVAGLFTDDTVYDWGTADGSGLPITGTFSETLLPLLDRDLLPATERACNEVIHGPTAGMTIVPESYEAVPFISFYRSPGPDQLEFDWGTWVVGIEQWNGQFYLSTLVHYAYEI